MGFVSGGYIAGSGGAGGGGIPDAPATGDIYGRKDNAWVTIPPGAQDTITLSFTRGGTTAPGAPISPAGGSNNAPGFMLGFAGTITAWSITLRNAAGVLTGGVNVIKTDVAWADTSTALTAGTAKDPGSNKQRASGAAAIAFVAGDIIRVTSACSVNVTQVTVQLEVS